MSRVNLGPHYNRAFMYAMMALMFCTDPEDRKSVWYAIDKDEKFSETSREKLYNLYRDLRNQNEN